MSDLSFMTAAEASPLIRDGRLSPVEYAQALLHRIEAHDHALNAFLRLTPEIALAEARQAEAEIHRGQWRGPLHGIPYGLKDIIDYAGLPTTAQSRILLDNIATEDAEVTRRLKAAGGVFMGKLATHEFAFGGPSFDLPWPPARNPWNRTMFAGSSSSGSGSALAAGFLPLALGTDTGGSVRHPASMCGITGMKPTFGLISRRGVVPLAWTLDTVGPMTRTVRDNAMLLGVLAGPDPRDPHSAQAEASDYLAGIDAGVRGLRIGVIRHFHDRDLVADPEMAASIDAATSCLEGLGAEIRSIETEPLQVWNACIRVILLSEGYAVHEKWLQERPQDYGKISRERLLSGATIRAADYLRATRQRVRLNAAFEQLFDGLDAIIMASSMEPAFPVADTPLALQRFLRHARMPSNVTGHPAIAIPTGFSRDGLPLSMQIVGRHFDEATVYRVARAYEAATEWTDRHPALAA